MNALVAVAARRLLALAVLSVVCLASCGDGKGGDARSSPPASTGEQVVIKTRIVGFDGTVLTGSVLGDAAFCPGGTLHHEHGSPQIGFPAVNVFSCQAGSLSIGFGPGPDQMELSVQTSDWRVLEGTGSFAGSTGDGTMRVEFEEGDGLIGRETFTGVLLVP